MKKEFIIFSILIAALMFVTESCKLATNPEDSTDVGTEAGIFKISGSVVDSSSGDPLESAIVKLIASDSTYSVLRTDADGHYSTEISIIKAVDLYVTASKEGYYARSIPITATAGDDKQMNPFQLRPFFNLPEKSVDPATINIFTQSTESIGVKESGSIESAEITFEVRDSSGVPLDLDHKSTVFFRLGGNPGGGEYLYPDSASTNGKGLASVSLNSGTVSGVVQVIAELTHNGTVIRSKPVLVAIHGGLPDNAHFSMAMTQHNLPGLLQLGYISQITAFVGDKYSNPVRPGTVVYFSTTGGIVDGSAVTDESGQATVNLYTASPQPTLPSKGIGSVTGKTIDENGITLETSQIVIFSGAPIITFSPTGFDVANGSSTTINVTVKDINGNPVAANSIVSFEIDGTGAKLVGKTGYDVPDALGSGYGITDFSITLADADDQVDKASSISISVQVSIPLSNSVFTIVSGINGIVH